MVHRFIWIRMNGNQLTPLTVVFLGLQGGLGLFSVVEGGPVMNGNMPGYLELKTISLVVRVKVLMVISLVV